MAKPLPNTPAQATMSGSPSTQAPVAQGLLGLSLTQIIYPVLLFCQCQRFLGPLLARPPQGASSDLLHLQLLLCFLGCDSCTLVCPQDLGGGEGSAFSLEASGQHKVWALPEIVCRANTRMGTAVYQGPDPQSLASRIARGTGMGGGVAMISKSQATLWGPQCYSSSDTEAAQLGRAQLEKNL